MGAKAAPIPLALGTKEKIEVSYADLVGTSKLNATYTIVRRIQH